VFTRIALALFGQLPWRGVPYIPGRDHAAAEVVPVPSRQGVLLVAHGDGAAVHPVHAQAGRQESARVHIRELFTTPPEERTTSARKGGCSPTVHSCCSIARPHDRSA
jgi:squalene-hopene/tetraprenyl-beta-curcumene cyclase